MRKYWANALLVVLFASGLFFTNVGGAIADTIAFRNDSSKKIWVAIFYYRPGCDVSNFASEGWWELAPGETKIVYSGEHRNWFYYFAENEIGEQYTSQSHFACVPRRVFSWCTSICNNDPD